MKGLSLHTIGFTKKTAEEFFELLREANVRRIIDVRLSNTAQLAGFAKFRDLEFFARELCDAQCLHLPLLAPDEKLFTAYKKNKTMPWSDFRRRFLDLMGERKIEMEVSPDLVDGACLLCSEHEPHECHRSLVAEYLRDRWDVNLEVTHLVEAHQTG